MKGFSNVDTKTQEWMWMFVYVSKMMQNKVFPEKNLKNITKLDFHFCLHSYLFSGDERLKQLFYDCWSI